MDAAHLLVAWHIITTASTTSTAAHRYRVVSVMVNSFIRTAVRILHSITSLKFSRVTVTIMLYEAHQLVSCIRKSMCQGSHYVPDLPRFIRTTVSSIHPLHHQDAQLRQE
jgi:hypothetical protein